MKLMKMRVVVSMLIAGMLTASVVPGVGCLLENFWQNLYRLNPCGTILSTNICTPDQWYAAIFDRPDWDVDPACPIPGQCQ